MRTIPCSPRGVLGAALKSQQHQERFAGRAPNNLLTRQAELAVHLNTHSNLKAKRERKFRIMLRNCCPLADCKVRSPYTNRPVEMSRMVLLVTAGNACKDLKSPSPCNPCSWQIKGEQLKRYRWRKFPNLFAGRLSVTLCRGEAGRILSDERLHSKTEFDGDR